jgi:hypothetical protein
LLPLGYRVRHVNLLTSKRVPQPLPRKKTRKKLLPSFP